jgi:enoyl-CoA hydratase
VFGEREVRFSASIASLILPWVIGPKAAKDILLTCRGDISTERAYQIGIVNHLVEPGKHHEKVIGVANLIATASASASAFSVLMTKRAIHRGLEGQGIRNACSSRFSHSY